MRKSEILLSSSGLGAGKKGSELGTNALRIAAAQKGYDIFKRFPVNELSANHQLYSTSDKYHDDYLREIVDFNEKICTEIVNSFDRCEKIVTVSGDHSNAVGSISGLRKAFPDKSIGVIWIDAHADIHSPFSTPSFNIHGMPLAALCGLDNSEIGQAIPSEAQRSFWEQLKSVGGTSISPKIHPKDIVFIDIRDLEQPEWDVIRKYGILHFTPAEVLQLGISEVVHQTLASMEDKEIIYITFDVDSLDPSISRGTGTPVDNGLSIHQAIELIRSFYHEPRCKMLEITEINPLLDTENTMAKTVVEILSAAGI